MRLDDLGNTALASTSTRKKPAFISVCLIILISSLAAGCGLFGNGAETSDAPPDGATEIEPADTASDPGAANEAATSPDETAGTDQPTAAAPQETPQAEQGTEAIQGQDVVCSTPNHMGQVTWQQGDPRLSVTRKPNQPVLNQASPVAIQRSDDNSVTYGYLQDTTAYVKTFPNGNCMVQLLDAQDNVTAEEYGRTS